MEIISDIEPTTRPDGTPLEIGDVWKQGPNIYSFDSLIVDNEPANTDIIHFDWMDALVAAAQDPNANLDLIEIPQGSNTVIEISNTELSNTEFLDTQLDPQWILANTELTVLHGGVEYTIAPQPTPDEQGNT